MPVKMTQSVILHLEDAGKQFPQNQTPAVQAVNLDLHEGDILGLLKPFWVWENHVIANDCRI